jgi:hypothetical protein
MESLPEIGTKYIKLLKNTVAVSMKSSYGEIPIQDALLQLTDGQFFDLLNTLKPDYTDDAFNRPYKQVCATPISRTVHFPDMQNRKSPILLPKTFPMKRVLWEDKKNFHRPLTPLSSAIMAATIPVMGPFMGKTWASLYHLSTDKEPNSFSDWLHLDTPTDDHYVNTYRDHGKTRFLWHTTIHMAENCGGGGDYMNMLWANQSKMAVGAKDTEIDSDTIMGIEALSGASFQDVVLAVFLSPIMYLHRDKAVIMYVVNGLAQTLLNTRDMCMGGKDAHSTLYEFIKKYKQEFISPQKSPEFLAAKRWAQLYKKYIDQHLSTILNAQFSDSGKSSFRAVDYFNDPQWTPLVALSAYDSYPHKNWFTWTKDTFRQGRFTASPIPSSP